MSKELEFVPTSACMPDIIQYICRDCGKVVHQAWYLVESSSGKQYVRKLVCASCKEKISSGR